MGTRQAKVEELLRREIAGALLRGDIKDHRVREQAMISVTGVRVSADLGVARIFVDVMAGGPPVERVVAGLNAAHGVFKRHLNKVLHMRRVPVLRFEHDDSIAQGNRIEQVLAELRDQEAAARTDDDDSGDDDVHDTGSDETEAVVEHEAPSPESDADGTP